ncbi:MAG: hypothetical protein IJD82_06245 [Clostridia bacterium]|nr:hypothetical protein [Clostridia bacterium]
MTKNKHILVKITSAVLMLTAFSVFALGKRITHVHRRMLQSLKIQH